MFDFHDMTQPGRVTEFTSLLRMGQFPPRMAPELSNNLGFPIFNFYAPGAYWITSILDISGLSAVMALKWSFMLGIALAGVGMYFYLKETFDEWAAYLGATLYITATYFATEIVIRGNLGEVWFLSFLPWAFYLTKRFSRKPSRLSYLGLVIVLWGLFTVHNIFSLLAFPLLIVYFLSVKAPLRTWGAFLLATVLSSYFWIPLLGEMNLTQAVNIAQNTRYQDHFLCFNQLWSSNGWMFGASLPGCFDGMSFKIGKIPFFMAAMGLGSVIFWSILRKESLRKKLEPLYQVAIFMGSIFLMLPASSWIWANFGLATFQFPWRFMILVMFSGSYLGAYFVFHFPKLIRILLVVPIVLVSFWVGRKYFVKPLYSLPDYQAKYNTRDYRVKTLSYLMPEYLTSKANFIYWQRFDPRREEADKLTMKITGPVMTKQPVKVLENEWFRKTFEVKEPGQIVINLHYFPYWQITHNGRPLIPQKFDKLGRPVLNMESGIVEIEYSQSLLQKLANGLTVIAMLTLLILVLRRPWKYS